MLLQIREQQCIQVWGNLNYIRGVEASPLLLNYWLDHIDNVSLNSEEKKFICCAIEKKSRGNHRELTSDYLKCA